MFYKISNELENNLKSLLKGVFTDEKFKKGIKAFENLINIENEKSNFNSDYGNFLNNSNILSEKWDMSSGCRVEGFLRKIENLKGNNAETDESGKQLMLGYYYSQIGFYGWLDDDKIKKARENDSINSANAQNIKNKGGFKLEKADAKKYENCPYFIDSYIVTYQVRNIESHDRVEEEDFMAHLNKVKSLFIVYLDQCIKNSDLINEVYEKELLKEKIDYVKYASDALTDALTSFEEFDRSFLQLSWLKDEKDEFKYDYTCCVKFIGEAGMGKTTQMKKMYYDLLQLVKDKKKEVLPIWIDLVDISKIQEATLEKTIRGKLGEYEQYYDLLLEKNVLVLFLDGYNEVLLDGKQDTVKKRLAMDIDSIHSKYKDIIIAMTDRCLKSVPPCLTKDVSVYTFSGFNKDQITEYVQKRADSDMFNKIKSYIDSEKGNWINTTKIIPAKINRLIDLISDDIIPDDENDFYDKYFDFILDREATDKKETSIDALKFLLFVLASDLTTPGEEKSQNEIIKLWTSNNNLQEATRLFKLAIELPILVPGEKENSYKFAYPQYYHKSKV